MSNVETITDVKVTALLSNPPQYVFEVQGSIALDKWDKFEFNNVIYEFTPNDKIQEITVAAIPLEGSQELETPIPFVKRFYYGYLPEWAIGVRFIAEKNEVEKILGPQKRLHIDFLGGLEQLFDRPVPWPWGKEGEKKEATFSAFTLIDDNNPFPFPFSNDPFPFPLSAKSAASSLVGHKLRVLRPGEVGDTGIIPGRVTIHVDENSVITSVTVDPGPETI